MSAELLREAAGVLRERAEMATPGTWVHNPINGVHTMIGSCIATTHRHVEDARRADAAYIATMRPSVGLAIAEWLLIEAHHVASHECEAQCPPDGCDEVHAATAVARLILGREAPS